MEEQYHKIGLMLKTYFLFSYHHINKHIKLDIFYVDSQIHGLDDSLYFILTKMTIPLDSPESTTFTLNRTVNKDLSTFIK